MVTHWFSRTQTVLVQRWRWVAGRSELVRSSAADDWASISNRTGRLPPDHWDGDGQALARLYPRNGLGNPARLVAGRRAARYECGTLRFDLLHPLHGQCWGKGGSGQLGTGHGDSFLPSRVVNVSGQGFLSVIPAFAGDADKVFAWAKVTYPAVFQRIGQMSSSELGYRYRSYADVHYLAVNDSGTSHLYYLGPLSNNTVLDLGALDYWVAQIAK